MTLPTFPNTIPAQPEMPTFKPGVAVPKFNDIHQLLPLRWPPIPEAYASLPCYAPNPRFKRVKGETFDWLEILPATS